MMEVRDYLVLHYKLSIDNNWGSGSNSVSLDFSREFSFSVKYALSIYSIKLFGVTIFDGLSWSPKKELFSKQLNILTKSFGCNSIDDIDNTLLFEGAFEYSICIN